MLFYLMCAAVARKVLCKATECNAKPTGTVLLGTSAEVGASKAALKFLKG
jgi:hypothetical protein